MKVLLSAGMIQGGRSGVGRYVTRVADGLVEKGVDLTIAGLGADRDLFPKVDDDHWLEIPESSTEGVRNLLWHQRHLPGEAVSRGMDLVHIPSYRRILWKCPVRQVSTIHDCAPFVLRDKYGLMRGLFGRWLTPFVARRCQQVITVSGYTAGHINKYLKVPKDRIEVVWNGIDHDLFQPASPEAIADFRKREQMDRPYFVYVSRLEHPGKNHVRLIEAYEEFRRKVEGKLPSGDIPELVFIGSDWQGSEVIRKRAAESPLAADIRFAGFVADEDLPLWYGGAKGMVMPSLFEGFGLPLVEAMACGCPVIASDIEVFREVAGENAIFVDPQSKNSISEALQQLVERDGEAQEASRSDGIQRSQAHRATCRRPSRE